jgi:hypothetical protein
MWERDQLCPRPVTVSAEWRPPARRGEPTPRRDLAESKSLEHNRSLNPVEYCSFTSINQPARYPEEISPYTPQCKIPQGKDDLPREMGKIFHAG